MSSLIPHRKVPPAFDGELIVAFVGAMEEISDWNFREQLEVNFFGTANIIRCVLPGMRRRRSGHIINITGLSIPASRSRLNSVAGQIGTPSLSLLSAAHHAVEGYSEVAARPSQLTIQALAYEVLPFNVKVSIVEPPIDAMFISPTTQF
jgi:NAD(P)-dependent dehydrogenase (short-subunit alcohol dehydrogenase family)